MAAADVAAAVAAAAQLGNARAGRIAPAPAPAPPPPAMPTAGELVLLSARSLARSRVYHQATAPPL